MENVETRRLLLLAVKMHEWKTGVETSKSLKDESNLQFNQLWVFDYNKNLWVFDYNKNLTYLFATSYKNNTLHLQMTLHKSPKSVQLSFQRYHSIVLLQVGGHHTFFSRFVAADIQRLVQ